MERERFVDKIALVTGGANGLGRGMVEQLVKEGAQVAIFDIEDDTMEEVFGATITFSACTAMCATTIRCRKACRRSSIDTGVSTF